MLTTNKHRTEATTLPDDLRLIPAAVVRTEWQFPESNLYRAEKNGLLRACRIGRRRFYRLSDLRAFVEQAAKAPPCPMPWSREQRKDGDR